MHYVLFFYFCIYNILHQKKLKRSGMRKGKTRSSERVGEVLERYINYKQPKIVVLEVAPIKNVYILFATLRNFQR